MIASRAYFQHCASIIYDENEAETTRWTDIDSAEEHHLMASLQHARYEQQLKRYHDRNVQELDFNIGDLVLRRIQSTTGAHKLSSVTP